MRNVFFCLALLFPCLAFSFDASQIDKNLFDICIMLSNRQSEATRELIAIRVSHTEDPFDFDRYCYLLGRIHAYQDCLHTLQPHIWQPEINQKEFFTKSPFGRYWDLPIE